MTTPTVLAAVPDRNRRLADGVLVDACILARVLGLRLLTLEARVTVLPADVTKPASARPEPPRPRTARRSSAVDSASSGAVGPGLADAVRCINEGAAILAEVRRDGSASGDDHT